MSAVKRYALAVPRATTMMGEYDIHIGMAAHSNGDYVLSADYDALSRSHAALVEALQDAHRQMGIAADCLEKGFNDEALLHLNAYAHRREAALRLARGES